jgi:hypothetical protein
VACQAMRPVRRSSRSMSALSLAPRSGRSLGVFTAAVANGGGNACTISRLDLGRIEFHGKGSGDR